MKTIPGFGKMAVYITEAADFWHACSPSISKPVLQCLILFVAKHLREALCQCVGLESQDSIRSTGRVIAAWAQTLLRNRFPIGKRVGTIWLFRPRSRLARGGKEQ